MLSGFGSRLGFGFGRGAGSFIPPGSPLVVQQSVGVSVVGETLGVIRGVQTIDVQATGATTPPATDLLSILGSLAQWHRASAGNLTFSSGSNVDTWLDSSGNGLTSSHNSGSNRCIWTAADATLDNKPTVTLGASTLLNSALTADLSASPLFFFGVMKITAWTTGRGILGGAGTTRPRLGMEGTSPQIAARATSSSGLNGNATLHAWKVIMVQWHASPSLAWTRVGSVTTSPSTNGTGTRTSSTIGANTADATFAMAEGAYHYGAPDSGKVASMLSLVANNYPSCEI